METGRKTGIHSKKGIGISIVKYIQIEIGKMMMNKEWCEKRQKNGNRQHIILYCFLAILDLK